MRHSNYQTICNVSPKLSIEAKLPQNCNALSYKTTTKLQCTPSFIKITKISLIKIRKIDDSRGFHAQPPWDDSFFFFPFFPN
jgi:hypothetical protein